MLDKFKFLLEKEEWTHDDERYVLNLKSCEMAFLAREIRKYDGILIDLSFHKNPLVRLGVAQNKYAPKHVLERLKTDTDGDVRSAASKTMEEIAK